MSDKTQREPLLIVGFDAADPLLLRRWTHEGHLPTLASLMERGCWAQTSSSELLLEHGAWLSIFSGISRARHGFYYFRQLKPGSYDLELVYGPEVDAPPFWGSWRNGRNRVVVADVPEGALQPGVPGLQITNWAVHRGYVSRAPAYQPISEPAGLLSDVNRKFGPPVQIIEDPEANPAKNRRMRAELLAGAERKGALCRHLIEREQADLVVCCFGESHTAGHQFWKYCGEGSAQKPAHGQEFANTIRDVYQAIDRQLGLLLAQMPPSTNVFVLSSIGLADQYPTSGLMEDFCRQLGYQARPEPNAISPMALLRRALPETWRISLSRRLSRESRERLFAQQFRGSADWQKTTAFAIPSLYIGFLRVNLRGREPEGIVEPGAQYDALLERLETDLRQLIDPQTGQPAIEKVARAGELYGCEPPEVLPDLIVHWKPCAHFLDRAVHPKAELTQKKPEFFRESEHTAHGFFAAAGPAIQGRGQIADVEVLDLAPTFLTLLGEPKTDQMTGNVIEELLQTELQTKSFFNSSGTPVPDLSVILVTPDCYGTIRKTIRSLRAQTVRNRLELVIVAPSKQALGLVEAEVAEFHSVRVVEFGEIQTLAAPRAAGVRAASAPLVALGEDHAFPEPGWAEALIEAHRQTWAAVGPAFVNANPGLMSWISLIMDYGRWIEPVGGGVTDDVPGHSSSWNRSLLLEYGPALERMMQAPTLMHWDMQAKGHRLYLEPAAKVRHININRLLSFVLDHFYGARIFAAARAQDWRWFYRLAYVGGTLLLMPRTLREWLGHIRRAGLKPELFPQVWPILLLALATWTLGAMAGYGLGLGKAQQRVLGYDASRAPHLSRRDRELLVAR